jgi:AcrR family transcriptional regulator
MAGPPAERADAAANRRRILAAAKRLFAERDHASVTMDDIAAAAGVGKGTLFRRFGDRAGLADALVDEYMRAFQDAFLGGPPPLGPGAPAAERLEAFTLALVRLQDQNLPLALAASARPDAYPIALGSLLVHLQALLTELHPAADPNVLANLVLGACSPVVIDRAKRQGAAEDAICTAVLALLRGLT